jgi:hypothetical protein
MRKDLAQFAALFVKCSPHFRFTLEGGKIMMKKLTESASVAIAGLLAITTPVLANAPEGGGAPDYSGITYLYYVMIGGILAYGVYDAFLKKS